MAHRNSIHYVERNATIAAMFKSGKTLEECGQAFGITRERCRQILKRLGVSRTDGGVHVRAAPARQAAAERKAAVAEKQARGAIERRCHMCKEVKPLEDFLRSKNLPHGRGYCCKPCKASYARARYHNAADKYAEQVREWQAQNKDKTREYSRRWYQKKKRLQAEQQETKA